MALPMALDLDYRVSGLVRQSYNTERNTLTKLIVSKRRLLFGMQYEGQSSGTQ